MIALGASVKVKMTQFKNLTFRDITFLIIRIIKIKINYLFLAHFPSLMWIKLKVKFNLKIKRNLQEQLHFVNGNKSVYQSRKINKKILMPQIETSHYQF